MHLPVSIFNEGLITFLLCLFASILFHRIVESFEVVGIAWVRGDNFTDSTLKEEFVALSGRVVSVGTHTDI